MSYPQDLNDTAYNHWKWVESMGWHKTTVLEQLALVASEVGEAVNECRGDKPTEQFGEELADIILRVLDISESHNINIQQEVWNKMAKNREKGNFKNRAK